MKILVLKPTSLGDVVLALPVLRMLKKHWPDAEVHWWIEAGSAEILQDDPDLAGLVLFHRRRWRAPRYWHEAVGSVLAMRDRHFDLVIDLQALLRSAVVSWGVGAGTSIGLDDSREAAPVFYDQRIPRPTPKCHALDWYLAVVDALEIPRRWDFEWLPVHEPSRQAVQRRWANRAEGWVVIQPGARWENKRWPVDYYAAAVAGIAELRGDLGFVVVGGPSERALGDVLAKAVPGRVLSLCGETSLREMVEWIRGARLFLGNDSGPMHIAAALKTPTVSIFGPTDPSRTGPYTDRATVLRRDLPCSPCLKDKCSYQEPLACLHRIPVTDVVRACWQSLLDWQAGNGAAPDAVETAGVRAGG